MLRRTFARAEITLIGVQDPLAGIHGPNESVYPHEIASMALADALFLTYYIPNVLRCERRQVLSRSPRGDVVRVDEVLAM